MEIILFVSGKELVKWISHLSPSMEIILFVLGSLITWFVSKYYYQKGNKQTPEWAKPLIEALPNSKPSEEELLKIVQDYIDAGNAIIHQPTQRLVCPKCGKTAKNFHDDDVSADDICMVKTSCPFCGWEQYNEV